MAIRHPWLSHWHLPISSSRASDKHIQTSESLKKGYLQEVEIFPAYIQRECPDHCCPAGVYSSPAGTTQLFCHHDTRAVEKGYTKNTAHCTPKDDLRMHHLLPKKGKSQAWDLVPNSWDTLSPVIFLIWHMAWYCTQSHDTSCLSWQWFSTVDVDNVGLRP